MGRDTEQNVALIAFVAALLTHVGIGYGLSSLPPLSSSPPSVVEVDVRKVPPPEPPKITPPEPPKITPPEPKKVVMKQKILPPPVTPPPTPPPNATPPKEPPKEPVKPVFGVNMDSTTEGDSSFAVPVGNSTMIRPEDSAKHTGKVAQLPASTAPTGKAEYKPVSELFIKSLPDIDADACGRTISYPSEAEQLGIEGDVKLRVALDELGHVHDIKVLSGLGHGLDEAAKFALTHRCKFTPARATDGKAVPYVIPAYVFHFEIPR